MIPSPLDTAQLVPGARPGEVRLAVVITGMLLWLLREYVEGAGGRAGADGWLHGDGWRARLSQAEDRVVGSIRVGQVQLEVEGTPEGVDALRRALAPKLIRGGG